MTFNKKQWVLSPQRGGGGQETESATSVSANNQLGGEATETSRAAPQTGLPLAPSRTPPITSALKKQLPSSPDRGAAAPAPPGPDAVRATVPFNTQHALPFNRRRTGATIRRLQRENPSVPSNEPQHFSCYQLLLFLATPLQERVELGSLPVREDLTWKCWCRINRD